MIRILSTAVLFALTPPPFAAASAQTTAAPLRPFCTTRPSLGAGACIVEIGHPMLEAGIADWQRERSDGSITDTLLGADALLRVGLGAVTEVQIGWTAIGRVRQRDGQAPAMHRTGVGDVSLALRQNLSGPDGNGFSLAVQPFVTIPVGRTPVGAGSWGAGLLIPVGYQIADSVQLQFTAEGDAAPDMDGQGRHLAFSGIAGIAFTVSDVLSTTSEILVVRDEDPEGHATIVLAAFSGGYRLGEKDQIDAGTAVGLNADSPDVRLFFGVSHRF